jgi:hypothetical protein
MTSRGAIARIIYHPEQSMTRGDSATVRAAVTLSGSLPPERAIGGKGAVGVPGLVVSCRLDARLTASTWDFSIDNQAWEERSFLTTDTAQWSWYVGPKIGGTHTLTLYVQPITHLAVSHNSAVSATDIANAAAAQADIQQYQITAHVKVPWSELPADVMARLAATLKVAQGLVEAMTLLVGAVVALAAALGIRRARTKRGGEPPRPDEGEEAAKDMAASGAGSRH